QDTFLITQKITKSLSTITGEVSTQQSLFTDTTLRTPAMTKDKQNGLMAAGGVPSPIRPYYDDLVWIERVGLSRAHRRLFLLIDGYRTIPELVRLMGRGEDEIKALLRDLEGADLIRQT